VRCNESGWIRVDKHLFIDGEKQSGRKSENKILLRKWSLVTECMREEINQYVCKCSKQAELSLHLF
jgi:hypothetical protein